MRMGVRGKDTKGYRQLLDPARTTILLQTVTPLFQSNLAIWHVSLEDIRHS